MADPEQLTQEQREFIESMGVFFEHYGLPRLVGRLMGLLMFTDRPLTLDDMAQALLVSRASVSTNIRVAMASGYAIRVGIPGDRRDHYRYSDTVWERRTRMIGESARATRIMAEHGLAILTPADVLPRARLEEMLDYCDFATEETRNMLEHWRRRKRAHVASHGTATPTPNHATARADGDGLGDEDTERVSRM